MAQSIHCFLGNALCGFLGEEEGGEGVGGGGGGGGGGGVDLRYMGIKMPPCTDTSMGSLDRKVPTLNMGNFPRPGGRSCSFPSSGTRIVLMNDISKSLSFELPTRNVSENEGFPLAGRDMGGYSSTSTSHGKALLKKVARVWFRLILYPRDGL